MALSAYFWQQTLILAPSGPITGQLIIVDEGSYSILRGKTACQEHFLTDKKYRWLNPWQAAFP